jgi:hypothetical protein
MTKLMLRLLASVGIALDTAGTAAASEEDFVRGHRLAKSLRDRLPRLRSRCSRCRLPGVCSLRVGR